MDIDRVSGLRAIAPFLASSAFVVGCFAGPASGQQSCVLTEQERVARGVEACVQILREEPSGPAHAELLKGAEDALGIGPVPVTGNTEVNVGDAKFAAAFTRCIRQAYPGYTGSDTSSVSLPGLSGTTVIADRYEYTNKYQIHRLRDAQRKITYDLIRIPSGGIEAMGTWTSDKPKLDGEDGCKNSYGDPCGTRYVQDARSGSYDKI